VTNRGIDLRFVKDLKLPDHIYENIQEYHEEKAQS